MENEIENIKANSVEENEEIIEESEENELEDQEEFTYTVDNNNINNDYNSNDKKSYVFALIGLIILILIIVVIVVIVNNGKNSDTTYSTIETKLLEGAKSYYNKYPDELPIIEGNYVTINAETLIENSYLKPFTEMVDEEVNCSGYVNVFKTEQDYAYFPYLNCGTEYETLKLNDKIIEDNIVTSNDGLYKVKNEYVFRGEYPNNYVKFSNQIWRIIKINEDGSIKLVYADKKTEKVVWDDRYNTDKSEYVGKNDFRLSRILEKLNEIYLDDTYIENNDKKLLVKYNWCIGKISENDTQISGFNSCDDIYSDLYIGLLNIDEVLIPSLDENCKNIYDQSCTNYNYLYEINTGWTLNASSERSHIVFYSSYGAVYPKSASTSSSVRPVININGNVLYTSGNGTKETPYIIKN